jgi:TRAP-type transport system periplasmic protein
VHGKQSRRTCRARWRRSSTRTALAQREEIARQNTSLKSDLAAKGLVFNEVVPAPFREVLSKSGFYAEWKGKFGEEAWSLLEESTGKLA